MTLQQGEGKEINPQLQNNNITKYVRCSIVVRKFKRIQMECKQAKYVSFVVLEIFFFCFFPSFPLFALNIEQQLQQCLMPERVSFLFEILSSWKTTADPILVHKSIV